MRSHGLAVLVPFLVHRMNLCHLGVAAQGPSRQTPWSAIQIPVMHRLEKLGSIFCQSGFGIR